MEETNQKSMQTRREPNQVRLVRSRDRVSLPRDLDMHRESRRVPTLSQHPPQPSLRLLCRTQGLCAQCSDLSCLRLGPAMARKRGSDAGWAFSLRGRSAFEDDSSSSDSDDDGRIQDEKSELADQDVGNSDHTGSDDSRLLQELDLSSRTDAATYKPNPWSIARANAATRSKPSTQPKRSAPNACKPNPSHPTVLDLLRRQPKKPPHPPSPPTDTRQLNSRSRGQGKQPQQSSMLRPPATTLEDEDDAHIPSDETLVDSGSNDPSYRTKLEDLDSANSTLLAPSIRSLTNASNGSSQPHFNSAPHTTSQLMMDSASPAISSASSTSQAVLRDDVPRQQDLRSLLFKPPADVQRTRLSPSSVHAPPQHSRNPHMPAPIPSPSLHTSGEWFPYPCPGP